MTSALSGAAEAAGLVVFDDGAPLRAARLRREWDVAVDPRLVALVLWVGAYCRAAGRAAPIVVNLARTRDDMLRIYGSEAKFPPRGSPHEIRPGNPLCRGADVRVTVYDPAFVERLVETVNAAFGGRARGDAQDTLLRHDVGHGDHLHFQVPPAPAAGDFWRRLLARAEPAARTAVGSVAS